MKQTFVNNIQQLMTANQNQRIKIGYLQSQKQKRQQYLLGLKQSIMLNKQTLIILNNQGPNSQPLSLASKQNLHLINQNQSLYQQNRQLNALLLMQQQLRTQQKDFHIERINQYQLRIGDLRKYLHDKEESYSNVAQRLAMYQQLREKSLIDKVQDNQGLTNVTNQIMAKMLIQKNMYKAKYQQVFENANRYHLLKQSLDNPVNYTRFMNNLYKLQNPHISLSQSQSPRDKTSLKQTKTRKNQKELIRSEQNPQKVQMKPNKVTQLTRQLIRLLKKQKINNQILQDALHGAIQKNQELIHINQVVDKALEASQRRMERIIAINHFLQYKIRQFNSPAYGNKYNLWRSKQDHDEASFHNLIKLTYSVKDQQSQQVTGRVYKDLLKDSLNLDVQKLMKKPLRLHSNVNSNQTKQFEIINDMSTKDITSIGFKKNINNEKYEQKMCEDNKVNQNIHKFMVKSASEPRIFIEWQDSHEQYSQVQGLQIDQI